MSRSRTLLLPNRSRGASSTKKADKKTDKKSAVAPKRPERTRAPLGTAGVLVGLIGVLCVFGLMMVLSSSSVDAYRNYENSWVFFNRQVIWMALGVAVLYFAARFDYRKLRTLRMLLLLGAVALLVLVLIPGIGIVVSGSRRWLGAGFLRMQPSELAKFAMLIMGADLLARRQHLVEDWRATLLPLGVIWFGFAALIMLQPDMGTTMIVTVIALVLLFVGGTPLGIMAKVLGAGAAIAAALAVFEPYRRERLLAFIQPFQHADDESYQIVQSFYAIANGGIGGVGVGASRAKWGFLPNSHTDFIFSIVGEELGLIGAITVLLLFLAFVALGVRAATRAPDQFGMLMAIGITTWVSLQAFLNIAAVIGLAPVTGVPLPFISQGGSSLVILMAASGVLVNIARQGDISGAPRRRATDEKEETIDLRT